MLRAFLKTATFRQSFTTVGATIINGVLGALFYIVLARFLGPSDFGLIFVAITALTLVADVADLGTNTGLVRFVSANLASHKEMALRVLKFSLEFKIIIWAIVLILGLFGSSFIAQNIFGKVELTLPLKLSFIGVGGFLLFTFITSTLQAFQRFYWWSALHIMTNLVRILVIFGLIWLGQLTMTSSLLTFITLPFVGFLVGLLLIPTTRVINEHKETEVAASLLSYNKWVAISTFIAAISSRMEVFIGAKLLSSFEIGLYGAASQLVMVIPQVITGLGIVAAPKFASFANLNQMLVYFKKFQILVLAIAFLGILAIPVAIFLIPVLFGPSFSASVPIFVVLTLAMLIFLISIPVHISIFYYFGKPKVFVWVSLGHLVLMILLGFVLITQFKVMGAAYTVLAGTIFNFLIPLIWFIKRLK